MHPWHLAAWASASGSSLTGPLEASFGSLASVLPGVLGLVALGLLGWLARRRAASHAAALEQLSARLDRERERSRAFVDSSHDLVCRYDLQGTILELSAAGARLLDRLADAPGHLRDILDARFLPLLIPSRSAGPGPIPIERSEVLAHDASGKEIWLAAYMRTIVSLSLARNVGP